MTSRAVRRARRPLWAIIVARIILASILVFATYNPTGFSYWHQVVAHAGHPALFDHWLLKTILGLLLFGGWWAFASITVRSMGSVLVLVAAILLMITYWLTRNLVEFDTDGLVWIGLSCLAFVLGLGASWGYIRRWFSATVQADELDIG